MCQMIFYRHLMINDYKKNDYYDYGCKKKIHLPIISPLKNKKFDLLIEYVKSMTIIIKSFHH